MTLHVHKCPDGHLYAAIHLPDGPVYFMQEDGEAWHAMPVDLLDSGVVDQLEAASTKLPATFPEAVA